MNEFGRLASLCIMEGYLMGSEQDLNPVEGILMGEALFIEWLTMTEDTASEEADAFITSVWEDVEENRKMIERM